MPSGTPPNAPPTTDPRPGGPPPPFQFTLRQLLSAMTTICVAAGSFYWLNPGIALVAIVLFAIVAVSYFYARRRQYGYAEAAVTIALGFVVILLILPAVQAARETPPWASCQYNMHSIALALQQYEIRNGTLPPAYIADADGKPMHSWRVLLLPYLEQNALYRQYRFDEPWDGPNNSQLHDTRVKIYLCPSERTNTFATNYVVVTGSQTIWPGATPTKLADIKDGPHNTIILVEVHNSGIHWMEPRDLDITNMPMAINAPKGVSISSAHHSAGFANVVFADGQPERIPNTALAKAIRAALTISGSEKDRLPTIRNRR
jgi:hypothetical protein